MQRSSSSRASAGFTLIEILVVMLIIGIMIVGAVFTTGIAHGDRDLERERDRFLALTDYLRDQAALQNRQFGVRCFQGGYEFLVYEPRTLQWQREPGDDAMRARQLPAGIEMLLAVEGRPVILPTAEPKPEDLKPQIMLFSSGELSLFELTLRRGPGLPGVRIAPSENTDRIEATAIAVDAT